MGFLNIRIFHHHPILRQNELYMIQGKQEERNTSKIIIWWLRCECLDAKRDLTKPLRPFGRRFRATLWPRFVSPNIGDNESDKIIPFCPRNEWKPENQIDDDHLHSFRPRDSLHYDLFMAFIHPIHRIHSNCHFSPEMKTGSVIFFISVHLFIFPNIHLLIYVYPFMSHSFI